MNEGTSGVSEIRGRQVTSRKAGFGELSNLTGGSGGGPEIGNETRSAACSESGGVAPGRGSRRLRRAPTLGGAVDVVLLARAEEMLKSLDNADAADGVGVQLLLTALVGTIADMWESAADATATHQEILATLENGVRIAAGRGERLSSDQSLAIKNGIHFLGQARLARSHAESVRFDFVEVGFPPMAFLE